MEIKAGLTGFKLIPSALLIRERRRGWEGEKTCLLHCAETQEQTQVPLFPQPSCSQLLTLPCPVPVRDSTGLTARSITP